MPFPRSSRVIYDINPLAQVICQLRYPTILRIGTSQMADFQDKIRDNYPVYNPQESTTEFLSQFPKEIAGLMEQMNLVPHQALTHRFYTRDSGRFVSLSNDFIAFAETDYQKWELFLDQLKRVEEALRETYHPAFYNRVGLRYQDMLTRSDLKLTGVTWNELLQPYIVSELGSSDVATEILSIRTQTTLDISYDVPGARVLLTHGLTKSKNNEECYVIDADFSIENKEGLDEPFGILGKFHELAGHLFRWAITEKLHMAMGPQRL